MAGPATPIGVEAIRVARLDADGTPDFNNPTGGFMLCGGISTFVWDTEVDTGTDTFKKDARGVPCVIRKQPDTIKRVTFTLTLCRDDYRLREILGDGDVSVVTDGSTVVGAGVNVGAGCGTATTKHGVSIELWSRQWDCDEPLANAPFVRTILPRAYQVPKGHTRDEGPPDLRYEGFSTPNANWGDGPFGDADLLTGYTGWAIIDLDNQVVPSCPSPLGYINVPGSAS